MLGILDRNLLAPSTTDMLIPAKRASCANVGFGTILTGAPGAKSGLPKASGLWWGGLEGQNPSNCNSG